MKAAKRFHQAFPKAGVSWPGITDGPMSEAGNEQREGRGPLPAGNLRVRGPDARCAPVRRVPRRGAPPPAEADLRPAARDRTSTRLNPVTNANLVCRLLLA